MATDNLLVITPEAMLSYPHLDVPQAPQKGSAPGTKSKYSATLVFGPGVDLATLVTAANAAGEEKWPGGKFVEMVKVGAARSPFRKDAEAKGYAPGSIFINVRSEQKPGAVYREPGKEINAATGKPKPKTIPDDKIREELYPGCKVLAQIRFFAYDSNGNKGVSAALNNIQKWSEGERLDNRVAATEAFDADLNAAPASLAGLI